MPQAINMSAEDVGSLLEPHDRDMDALQLLCNNSDINKDSLEVGNLIRNILIITFDIIGISGNLLSCIVIKRYLLKTSGTYILFLFLALSDTLVMIVVTLEVIRHNFPTALMPSTTAGCVFHSFFFNFSFELSAWIILALTVERYLTIRSPFTHRERSKIIRRAWRIGGSIVAVLVALNFQYFFTKEIRVEHFKFPCYNQRIHTCHFRDNGTAGRYLNDVSNYIHAFAYCYIPYIVTFGFNLVLLYRLFVTRNYSQNRRTTVMLLLVTFSFIILTLPHAVYTIIVNYTNTGSHRRTRQVVRDAARVLLVVNHSLNFAFYMTGRQFRMAVTKLFCSRRRRRSSANRSRRHTAAPFIPRQPPHNHTRCSELEQLQVWACNGGEHLGMKAITTPGSHDFPLSNRNRHCSNNSYL